VRSLRKGAFSGSELFLNDVHIKELLIKRLQSHNPLEVVNALNLLERSCYPDIFKILLHHLHHQHSPEVREYIIERIIANHFTSALPLIKRLIDQNDLLSAPLYKALFYLDNKDVFHWEMYLESLQGSKKKAALAGLTLRKDEDADLLVRKELQNLIDNNSELNGKLAIEVIIESESDRFRDLLESLMNHESEQVVKYAMVAAGKIKAFELSGLILTKAQEINAWYSFEKAVVHYGDNFFREQHLSQLQQSEKATQYLIKAASKIKGSFSDDYLINLFEKEEDIREVIIDSLWKKKTDVAAQQKFVEDWARKKIEELKIKTDCFLNVHGNKSVRLLENALISEIQQGIESVLKAFALIYNRGQIDRFIEVYKLDNATKVANAIELLEMTIPKRYFNALSQMIDMRHDLKRKQLAHRARKDLGLERILNEVVNSRNAHFNSWSRSVALFMLPGLMNKESALAIAGHVTEDQDPLLNETRNYVLSVLR
jgi:hypothetical protein